MRQQRFRLQDHWAPLACAGVLLLTFFAYLPGLAGGFLFDDFVNLRALGGFGRVDNADAFWRYVTSGSADPTGRPIALLSFLLDARDWPADPTPFLLTNVLLHLINGALLYVLLRLLGQRLDGASGNTDLAAVLGAGLWLLHPLFVSTTLYIVQREAMLPATFTLLGLLAWTHGRSRFNASPGIALFWMLGVFGACTLLAVLSKANGMLLPLLTWVIDAVLLRPRQTSSAGTDPRIRAARGLVLVTPSLLIFGYLMFRLRDMNVDLASRPWTIGERLLTEPRVLVDYLQLLIVPRVLSTGLYNDGYVASNGWLSPPSTILALLAIVALVAAGFAMRRRAPALACALLFFFAGHLLESTVVPLELYFEHRNYLPALLLGWPIARWIVGLSLPASARVTLGMLLLMMLAAITWQRASLWARQDEMALLWAAQNPTSSRAQATAAIFETRNGQANAAVSRLAPLARKHPSDLQLVVNLASARCATGGLPARDAQAVAYAFRTAKEGDQLVYRWLGQSLETAHTRGCLGIDYDTIGHWVDAARANPRLTAMPGRQQDLNSIAGRVALAQRRPAEALQHFDRALDAEWSPQAALMQAGLLASAGCYAQALHHLDRPAPAAATLAASSSLSMKRVHRMLLRRQAFWQRERDALRATITDDLVTRGNNQCGQ